LFDYLAVNPMHPGLLCEFHKRFLPELFLFRVRVDRVQSQVKNCS
jgi:hypothetical protein